VPAYFDFLIDEFRRGHGSRDVHLGYWDDPPSLDMPCHSREFETAQARLTEIMIGLADLRGAHDVLDIGCGLGGTLEALARWPDMRLVGINVDRRQLDICRGVPVVGNSLSLVMADACTLPFRSASFDRVFCVEAAFHFRSRGMFLYEAANALRAGGRLVLSDILLGDPGQDAPYDRDAVAAAIRRDYGPWPQLWVKIEEILDAARHAGLRPDRVIDATRQTLPSYRVTAPQHHDAASAVPSAGEAMRWLHANGHLSYVCLSFVKN
jgi:cyclopropane fatty-acyl-phospholipid synthase-like methyltransferase